MGKEHIFFDLDGTLTDSMPGITRAVQYALKRYGIEEENLDVLKPFVGPPLPESFRKYYHFSKKDAEEAVFVFREYYNVTGWLQNAPYPGVEEMLERLQEAGKTLYVATSKPEWMAKQVLEHFKLAGYFKMIGGGDDAAGRYEKDDVIRYVMERNEFSDGSSIVMVGDRRHDIAGAHKNGVSAAGVLFGYGSREELETAGADWIAESVQSLAELLKTL